MKVLKALDLGPTPSWVTITALADWGLELACGRCGCTGSVRNRDLAKQQAAVGRWLEHHNRCPEKKGG